MADTELHRIIVHSVLNEDGNHHVLVEWNDVPIYDALAMLGMAHLQAFQKVLGDDDD